MPHPLGVLGHFDAVVWELGDNRLTQDPEDELTDTFLFGAVPRPRGGRTAAVPDHGVRDYLNEGGKLVAYRRDRGQYFGLLGGSIGGIYYGLDGAPEEDCVGHLGLLQRLPAARPTTSRSTTWARTPAHDGVADPTGFEGPGALDGVTANFGGPAVATTRSTRRARSP